MDEEKQQESTETVGFFACFEIGLRYFLGIKDKYQSENMAKYYFNKAGLSFDEALKLIKLEFYYLLIFNG